MCLSSPSVSSPTVTTAPAPTQQTYTNSSSVMEASSNARRKQAAAQGFSSTVKTSGSDLGTASTSKKTLLGQ